MEKKELLKKAYVELNRGDYPFEVVIDKDTIIATWKWKDGTFFDVGSVTREIQEFKYVVKLLDDKTYIENDSTFSQSSNVNVINQGAKSEMQGFSGKQWNKHVEYTFGKDKDTDKLGVQKYTFDTEMIHKPIQEFLSMNGYTKVNQNLFQVQKTSLSGLDKNLLKILGYLFTFIGGSMSLINLVWFLSTEDNSFVLVMLICTLVVFVIGIICLITSKKRK